MPTDMKAERWVIPGAVETRDAVRCGAATAMSVAEAALQRVERLEPSVHAWEAFNPDIVLHKAQQLDRARAARKSLDGELCGVPVAVKDLFDSVDWPTGYGSPLYRGHRPTRDAEAVRRVIDAGALVMGKTVTTEFGYFQPGSTANPWNPLHTPGGSSSGSAAAVASGMVPLAFGTQTAGSLIRPASYCGVFALKPTFGRFSLEGVKGLSPSMDTIGWMANSADDLELMRSALNGEPFRPLPPLSNVRLASSKTHEWGYIEPAGAVAWQQAHRTLVAAGVLPQAYDVPKSLEQLFIAQKTIMSREACWSLSDEYTDSPEALSPQLRLLLETGQRVSDEEYYGALSLAKEGRRVLARDLESWDALIVPAAPGEAPLGLAATGDPAFSRVWNLLGFPCVNVPVLEGPRGLPIGLQVVGRPNEERALLAVAKWLHDVFLAADARR